ncbi:MarR family winged helix-turn-helix transcriptional regulator [Halolactibacillus sp. JCM 19043]|uniref:MarR family winged helix-turn-helix transcriptional regulator n=1 Tax=Halolactibacillus sp. JCM 19043 TaxID=1460638 RepID=UPI00078185D9|nr:MarR family winged helix-turn-helix transcriptional regulator [Halolactibacillus sp. JCM 19043]
MTIYQSMDVLGRFCRLKLAVKQDLPLRSSEMGVLIYLSKQTGDVTPLMVSEFLRVKKPSVTPLIQTLIKKEYVTKQRSQVDKRSYTLQVTERGSRLLEEVEADYLLSVSVLKEKLGNDQFNDWIRLTEQANTILEELALCES